MLDTPWRAVQAICTIMVIQYHCGQTFITYLAQKQKKKENKMKRVFVYVQGKYRLGALKKSAWALKPPTNSEGFVVGKVWAITRIGLTSRVKKSHRSKA